jgi:hypothetical protein
MLSTAGCILALCGRVFVKFVSYLPVMHCGVESVMHLTESSEMDL